MIASAQTLRSIRPVEPFVEKGVFNGLSYGLGPAGYDIRMRESVICVPNTSGILVSSLEEFNMPHYLLGTIHTKSTWARVGLFVPNTVIEPGWKGFLTLRVMNHGPKEYLLTFGTPIAQVVFHFLDAATDTPYSGKYQFQPSFPVAAKPVDMSLT